MNDRPDKARSATDLQGQGSARDLLEKTPSYAPPSGRQMASTPPDPPSRDGAYPDDSLFFLAPSIEGRSEQRAPRIPPASLDFALLRGAVEEMPFGVATTRAGVIIYANGALERMFDAPPGGLEQKHVRILFGHETFIRMGHQLDDRRVFDGRIQTFSLGGRPVDAEVHVEWYTSELLGIGGFIVFRDVSLETNAIGRLIDQLSGVLFSLRIESGSLEFVSPAIAQLVGIDAATCTEHPVLLTNLVTADERERLLFLYKRVVEGEITTATTQVTIRRPDGRPRAVMLRATGRRDAAGVVRHIEGIATDATREAHEATRDLPYDAPPSGRPSQSSRAATTPARRVEGSAVTVAVAHLTQVLLREASQHIHTLGRELRFARGELGAGGALTREDAADLAARVASMTRIQTALNALNLCVRKALAGGTTGVPLADVLESVRATLAPVIGARSISVDPGDTGALLLETRVDELALALVHLGLRAFRTAGSGSLQITARTAPSAPPELRIRTGQRPPTPTDTLDVLLDIQAAAAPDSSLPDADLSGELTAIPKRAEADQALAASKTILAAVLAGIDVDEATLDSARTQIRMRRG